ncbi:hypothetical protein DICVIV_12935 [Dictyocaulus viviparus]|uniref:Uncharacterized protein n=1 Tax=Dictyocaulus viviparus TaxID=29172 RepID=A0A0D8XF81_DICVI|nr:hypothetical protein DICVIV_12935 [Dictyocaulus viviparus]
MLAPIITKDMKLFPSRPLPAGIKNVRSRAQSLDQFNQVQNSGSARGRIIPVKPRSSQSTGNLPAVAASSASGVLSSRSPPKGSVHRKTTLSAIQEGVEMGHSHQLPLRDVRHTESQSNTRTSSSMSRRGTRKAVKSDKENEGTRRNGHCKCLGSTNSGDCRGEKKGKKGVVKWLTSAFRKSKDKDSSDNSSSNSS